MAECEGISENLHRLINTEEYENKKLVRLIDYENDKQTGYKTFLTLIHFSNPFKWKPIFWGAHIIIKWGKDTCN